MMNRPWMVWAPGIEETRVMVTSGDEILLKAKLSPGPSHPRAAQWLMEAIALWEGAAVRAVISAGGEHGSYASHFWDAVGMDLGGALYTLGQAACEPGPRRRQLSLLDERVPELEGFDDLEALRVADALGGGR